MKRLKMAIAILIVTPLLIFASHAYMKKATNDMINTLSSAEKLSTQGQKQKAAKSVEAFEGSWEVNKGIMATFIKHSELDVVNLSSARLKPLLDEDGNSEFLSECESLKKQLHHLWESDKFSFDNVL